GYFLACFSIHEAAASGPATGMLVMPIVLLWIPLADTLYAIGRRLYLGVSPFSADRGHLHHRLLALLTDQRSVVRAISSAALLLGVACSALPVVGRTMGVAILVVVVAATLVVARGLSLFDLAVISAGRCNRALQADGPELSTSGAPEREPPEKAG
ncbi:MAG: hypothetical protein HY815_31190, partial [Candidatus Riflebacteria bacterium]|nr:hypothetical protein [Candidatus Riflebacteria bacterium]